MRIVQMVAGVLLLVTGIPVLLGGAVLGADLTLDLRAELRADWVAPVTAGLLVGGMLLVSAALALLLRPVRPREVVFVVEPDQVPVLAGRLGVTSLNGLGVPVAQDRGRVVPSSRQLVSVGAPVERPRPMPRPAGPRTPVPAGNQRVTENDLSWPFREAAEAEAPPNPGRPSVRRLRPSAPVDSTR
ncbi:hypothetical protein [Salinispora arenicola]|uniref:hypothetical protein n=1 Tax=Salinispora arenicola TaxID=168697 RepID=UPI00038193E2|nr:hypothetical protein [Salinispora arenicola]